MDYITEIQRKVATKTHPYYLPLVSDKTKGALKLIERFYGKGIYEIRLDKTRKSNELMKRQCIQFVLFEGYKLSHQDIAAVFGYNRTSIIHNIKCVNSLISSNNENYIEQLKKIIQHI